MPRRSQGTLLPLSARTQGIESVEQCATQGFNLVKQGTFFRRTKLHLIYEIIKETHLT
jgi:hypothetical protein